METIRRILQDKIVDRLAPGKAVLIFGARRVGKTVMMRNIVSEYAGRVMMLNGEDYDTLALLENRTVSNYRHLLEGIDLLAIDEAQNVPHIGDILKQGKENLEHPLLALSGFVVISGILVLLIFIGEGVRYAIDTSSKKNK